MVNNGGEEKRKKDNNNKKTEKTLYIHAVVTHWFAVYTFRKTKADVKK